MGNEINYIICEVKMKEYGKDYHHGNLRKELIEKGIKMINDTGEEKLSLRKIGSRMWCQ